MTDRSNNLAMMLINLLNLSSISISTISKLPQIRTVVTTKAVGGISPCSLLLETCRLAILWTYNYCFGYSILTYLEYPFLLLQTTVLIHFVTKYQYASPIKSSATTFAIFCSILLFVNGVLPKWILGYLLATCPAMVIISRFAQLAQIVQTKQADNINVTSWLMTTYTGLARLIAVLLSTGDKMLVINFLASLAGSVSIVISAIYYQRTNKKSK